MAPGRFGMILQGQRSVVGFSNLAAQPQPNTDLEEIARKLEEIVRSL